MINNNLENEEKKEVIKAHNINFYEYFLFFYAKWYKVSLLKILCLYKTTFIHIYANHVMWCSLVLVFAFIVIWMLMVFIDPLHAFLVVNLLQNSENQGEPILYMVIFNTTAILKQSQTGETNRDAKLNQFRQSSKSGRPSMNTIIQLMGYVANKPIEV